MARPSAVVLTLVSPASRPAAPHGPDHAGRRPTAGHHPGPAGPAGGPDPHPGAAQPARREEEADGLHVSQLQRRGEEVGVA